MAKLYISEYSRMAKMVGESISVSAPQEPCHTDQAPITITGTSADSAVFGVETTLIRVHTDAICSIAIGKNPTATTNSKRMVAGGTEYFGVEYGHKLAVIANT